MKKIVALFLLISMLMVLAACGADISDYEKSSNLQETEINNELKLYPLSTSEYVYYEHSDIPEIIFSTTGAENGLSGTIYSFTGKMIGEHEKLSESFFVVETKYGNVLLSNVYNDVKNIMPVDKESYTTPEIGEVAKFTCIYDGFSNVAEMPAFTYGNDAFLLESYVDSNESTNNEETTPVLNESEPEPLVFEGSGDKVITDVAIESGRYKVHVVYNGNGVFSVFGYDADDSMVISESSYGSCEKESVLRRAKSPLVLEVSSDSSWKIEFEKID